MIFRANVVSLEADVPPDEVEKAQKLLSRTLMALRCSPGRFQDFHGKRMRMIKS